jgi:hypothetical protein
MFTSFTVVDNFLTFYLTVFLNGMSMHRDNFKYKNIGFQSTHIKNICGCEIIISRRAGGIGLGSEENRRRRVVTHVFTNNFLLSYARQILFSELFVHGQGVLSIYLLALCHLPN